MPGRFWFATTVLMVVARYRRCRLECTSRISAASGWVIHAVRDRTRCDTHDLRGLTEAQPLVLIVGRLPRAGPLPVSPLARGAADPQPHGERAQAGDGWTHVTMAAD